MELSRTFSSPTIGLGIPNPHILILTSKLHSLSC